MILETNLHVSIAWYLGTIVLLYSAHILYRGLSIKLRFRKLQAQGMPVTKPYSIWLGHIPLMKALRKGLPSEAHDTYVARKLSLNWKDYFPDASSPPPLAYLNLWSFLAAHHDLQSPSLRPTHSGHTTAKTLLNSMVSESNHGWQGFGIRRYVHSPNVTF